MSQRYCRRCTIENCGPEHAADNDLQHTEVSSKLDECHDCGKHRFTNLGDSLCHSMNAGDEECRACDLIADGDLLPRIA